jgi:hypothetical protein
LIVSLLELIVVVCKDSKEFLPKLIYSFSLLLSSTFQYSAQPAIDADMRYSIFLSILLLFCAMSLFTSFRNSRNSASILSRHLFVPTPFKSSLTVQNAAFGGMSTVNIARTSVSQLSRMRMSTQIETDAVGSEVDNDTTAEDLFGFDLPTNDNSPNLLRVRHTTNHIMAMAVQRLHPEAQVTIGPWIDQGYDKI